MVEFTTSDCAFLSAIYNPDLPVVGTSSLKVARQEELISYLCFLSCVTLELKHAVCRVQVMACFKIGDLYVHFPHSIA